MSKMNTMSEIVIAFVFLFLYSTLVHAQVVNSRTTDSYSTIQDAIDGATSGDTLIAATGTYTLSTRITINKGVILIGEDESTTIIDASGNGTNYGILISSSNVTLSKFTILPPVVSASLGTSSGGGYAIHTASTPSTDLEISHVTIEDGNRTGFDIHGVTGVVLDNVTSRNAAYGNGISLTGVTNATLTNITTSGNEWGGIAIYVSGPSYNNQASSNININTSGSSISDSNMVYVEDISTLASTDITIAGFDYEIQNKYNSASSLYKWYTDNLTNASMMVLTWIPENKWSGSESYAYIKDLSTGMYHVTNGMSIQTAIDSSSARDTILVAAGTYEERVVIEKPLTLRGATYSVNKNGYTVPSNYAWDESVESIISNPEPALTTSNLVDIANTDSVTFEGFVVQSLNALSGSANDHLLRVYAHTQGMDNIVVRNNIIGPNTNTTSQDGTNGRMGLYLAAPNYSDFDITNSTFSGNKIFDCLGNGNNVFIWGGAESYLNGEWLELTGTTLEDNEIYGSHRSGIEIAGGVDDLTIRNNKIYNNSGTADADSSNLKYGNGILIIRMGSDKASATGYGADNIIITNNEIYNNQKNGIYFGPINSNHTITSNNIHDNGYNGIIIDLEENYHGAVNPVYSRVSSITASGNTIEGNSKDDVNITGTPTNSFVLDAESNWWGDTNPSDQVAGSVDYIPYLDAQGGSDEYPPVQNQTSTEYYFTIQEAIDSASAGDVVKVDAGTFTENLNINKRITLKGTLNAGSTATLFKPTGDAPIINLTESGQSGSALTIQDLHLYPDYDNGSGKNGIYVGDGVSVEYITIDNVDFTGTDRAYPGLESGIYIDMDGSVSNITISDCNFSDLAYGLTVNKSASSSSGFSDATITGCTFNNNISKAMYFEKLSSATITSSTFSDNGDTTLAASWAKAYCTAIDVNLKYGDYTNVTFSNLTFSNNGLGSTYGSALSIKARGTGNDPSYSADPATLDTVSITGCAFQNNKANIRFGEPGKDNTQPANVSANGNAFTSFVEVSVQNNSSVVQDLNGNWWGSKSPNWATDLSGNILYSPWWRSNYVGDGHSSAWGWGADTSLQAAINTVSAGDTINADAGTYDEALTISKKIILNGSGSGESGTIIQSSSPSAVTGGATYPSGYKPVVRISASGSSGDSLIIKNLRIRPRQDLVGAAYPLPGILFELNTNLSYIKLDNVQFVGTSSTGTPEMGIVTDGSTGLNHFSVTNSEFRNMAYGLIFFNDVNDPTTLQNFKMSNTVLQGNGLKGLYTEKMSDADFSFVTVSSNGDTLRSPSWADANNAGIDLNLKSGNFSNISFTNLSFSNNGTGSSNGAGLSLKARGTGADAGYASNPATLSSVRVTNCVFDTEVNAINLGENGKGNTGPSTVLINNNSFGSTSFAIYDQRGSSADTIDATGNWWGSVDGPDDNASDGTASYVTSSGEKIYELSDKIIAYAPWYYMDPDDNSSSEGVNQQSSKVFWVEESVPFASKGYINKGIQLASTSYVDTLDIQISTITETPDVDRNVVLKFSTPPTLPSLDVSSGDLELSNNVTVSGGLNLSNGNVTTGNNTLTFGTSATNPTETDDAKIIGTVEVQPRSVGTGSYEFLGFQLQSGDDDLGNVSLTRKSGTDGAVSVQGNTGIQMTWDIDVDNQPTSGRSVTFKWPSSFDNGVDPTNIIVYRNTGSGWQYFAGPVSASGNPRAITITTTGFSSWTVGGAEDPLPVELVDFTASTDENGVKLNWTTATEINNYGFEIQRQAVTYESLEPDTSEWTKVGFVAGNGNSNSPKSYEFTDEQSPVGELQYRLKQIDTDGSCTYYNTIAEVSNSVTGIKQDELPTEFSLYQNYPNPFNPATTIKYAIPVDLDGPVNVLLKIYNLLGQEVVTLVNEEKPAGIYELQVNAPNLASGIYYYSIYAGGFIETRKMILLK